LIREHKADLSLAVINLLQLFVHLFFIFRQINANTTHNRGSLFLYAMSKTDLLKTRLLARQQLVPQLECSVYHHMFHIIGRELFPVWTYVTNGMHHFRQKEIIFVLKCLPEERTEDFPSAPLSLFKIIFDFAKQGVVVDEGDTTEFGPSGYLGRVDFKGVSYVKPEFASLPDEIPQDKDYLVVVTLMPKEFEISKKHGITRILAMMGMQTRYYPFPLWTDRQRTSVAPEDLMLTSDPISESPHMMLCEGGAHLERSKNMIFMKLAKALTTKLRNELAKVPDDVAVVCCLGFDPFSDCHLVWQPNSDSLQAISRPGSKGERMGSSFIAFIPQQKEDYGMLHEDGFLIMLTNESWALLRKCFITGSKAVMLSDTEDGMNFELSFYEKLLPATPGSQPTFVNEFEQQGKDRNVAIKFITAEHLLIQRVSVQDMANYTKSVTARVKEYLAANKPLFSMLKELYLLFEVVPGNKLDIRIVGNPVTRIDSALEDQIVAVVNQLPVVDVQYGPVDFQISFPIESYYPA
jgi:hypothetical protein